MPNILQPSLSNTPTYVQKTETTGIAPYANDLLQRGQAFTTADTPIYGGQLTTGPSQYQNQAWQGLANLTVPQNITAAGTQLGDISQQQQNLAYTPGNITNTYNPAAGNYKPIDVTAGTFGAEEAQKYMNPYIQQALDPQLDYMRRQAAINQQGDMAKLAQAGAFGGSRQAILQGQNQEALLRQQAATTGQGYQQAFTQAQQQFNADQARQMEATKANIQQAQTAAQMGMTDAQMMAQYGMTAQQANEASRQFGAGYKQTALANAANTEQARAQTGGQEAQYGLANLNALSTAGATQHEQEQAALDASYKDWLRQTEYPGKQLETMKGLTTAMADVMPKTETGYGQKQSALTETAGGIAGIAKIANQLGIKNGTDVANLASKLGMPVDKLASIFGITIGPDTSDAKSTGQTGLPSSETGGGYTPNDQGFSAPPPGYHRDETGALVQDGQESPEVSEESDVPAIASGGLIDLLHKMRSHK
jgi:hypothetical protein